MDDLTKFFAEAIVKNWYRESDGFPECSFCDEDAEHDADLNYICQHAEDCVVLKAEKYLTKDK